VTAASAAAAAADDDAGGDGVPQTLQVGADGDESHQGAAAAVTAVDRDAFEPLAADASSAASDEVVLPPHRWRLCCRSGVCVCACVCVCVQNISPP